MLGDDRNLATETFLNNLNDALKK
jgi:hypothetical protein